MRIFLEKISVKIVSVLGAPHPDLRILSPAYYYNFVEFDSGAKCILLPSKNNKITTVNVLLSVPLHFAPTFQFKLCSFG